MFWFSWFFWFFCYSCYSCFLGFSALFSLLVLSIWSKNGDIVLKSLCYLWFIIPIPRGNITIFFGFNLTLYWRISADSVFLWLFHNSDNQSSPFYAIYSIICSWYGEIHHKGMFPEIRRKIFYLFSNLSRVNWNKINEWYIYTISKLLLSIFFSVILIIISSNRPPIIANCRLIMNVIYQFMIFFANFGYALLSCRLCSHLWRPPSLHALRAM